MKHTVVSTIAFAPAYLYNKKNAMFFNCFLEVFALKVWNLNLKKGEKGIPETVREKKSLEIPEKLRFRQDKIFREITAAAQHYK